MTDTMRRALVRHTHTNVPNRHWPGHHALARCAVCGWFRWEAAPR